MWSSASPSFKNTEGTLKLPCLQGHISPGIHLLFLFFLDFSSVVAALSAIASNCGNLPFLWRNAGMTARKIMHRERLSCSPPSSAKLLRIPLVILSNYPIFFQCTSFIPILKACCSLKEGAAFLWQRLSFFNHHPQRNSVH